MATEYVEVVGVCIDEITHVASPLGQFAFEMCIYPILATE